MLKTRIKRDTSPEINQGLSTDDLDALLKFPYDQYLNAKQEENEVEALHNFVLNHDAEQSNDVEEEVWEEGITYDQEDVKTVTSCLSLNKNMQFRVNRLLSKVQNALEKNKNKQVDVKNYLDAGDYRSQFDLKTKTSKPISLFASPYFRDVRGMVPPENDDTVKKRLNHDVTAYLQPPRPWMVFEKHKLFEAVHSNCLSYILKPHKAKRNYLRDKLKEELKNLTTFEETTLKKQIREKEKEINAICKRPRNEIITEARDHIKWHEITLDGNRNGEECEVMWNNYLGIFINKDIFTTAEDEKLQQLAEKHNGKNWDVIAEELQTGRSAIQCFERYQKNINKAIRKKYWTPDEDSKLLQLVESNRIGDFIPWNIVCSRMKGRERHQILNRYERTINNLNKRTPWTKEEDAMLLMCVKKFGTHWTRMKEYIPGRNPYNIRERYVNILDPYIKCGPWMKSEDQRLTELVKKHGYGKWSVIAKGVPGRTDNMCLIRANYLGLKPVRKTKINGELCSEPEKKPKRRRAPRNSTKPSSRLRIQGEALETLKAALTKVAPAIMDETMETLNVPSIHVALMKDLHRELYKNEEKNSLNYWKPRYLSSDGVSKIDFTKQKKDNPKRKYYKVKESEIEEDEEIEDFGEVEEENELNNEEILWLHNVLMSQFNEAENLVKLPAYINNITLNSRHSAECSIYGAYLKQRLMCSDVPVDEEDYIFGGNNYNITLADIVHHFILPSVSEEPTMVLAPNWATLHGMDIIQVVEKRLHRTGKFINHNIPYIRYLTGRSPANPKCIKCSIAEKIGLNNCDLKYHLKQMKANLIISDEDTVTALMVEDRQLAVEDQECCCEELAKSQAAADLLSKRFMSLFLWPALLSSVNLNQEQEELMVRQKQPRRGPIKQQFTKRNYSSPSPKKRRLNGSRKSAKMMVKNEPGLSSTVSPSDPGESSSVSPNEPGEGSTVPQKVKRKRRSYSCRRKLSVKHEDEYESDSDGDPEYNRARSSSTHMHNSGQSTVVPLRRSQRSTVLQRRSFAFVERKDEESS